MQIQKVIVQPPQEDGPVHRTRHANGGRRSKRQRGEGRTEINQRVDGEHAAEGAEGGPRRAAPRRRRAGRIARSYAWLQVPASLPLTLQNRLSKKKLGVVEDEVHVVFVCPLYDETLMVNYSELFRAATNLNIAFSSAQIARNLYGCYLTHVESVAETRMGLDIPYGP
jgi:hypothetical protein